MKYRTDIDGRRAMAILPVVAFHAQIPPFSGGFIGVDVFFVISGFLISSIILSEVDAGQFSIVSFYERRIRRIFPGFSTRTTMAAPWLLTGATLQDGAQRRLPTSFTGSACHDRKV
jgi:peptidoglycan/LPS O-acetylase OafA/YrhL